MPVDKCRRNVDRATSVYTGMNLANLRNRFLRRDGGNTVIGAIDMHSNIFKKVTDLLSNENVAIQNYVDKNAITTDGGIVYDDIKLSVVSNLIGSLRCNDLTTGKKFTLLLGKDTNVLSYFLPDSHLPEPIQIKTEAGLPS